jgi:anti-sigma regulatory factor (Ser/Thr protein kinase)
MTERRSFQGRRESIGEARRFARGALADQPREALEEIELMVSELATNCVQHAESDFDVAIERSSETIRVEARDRGGGRPTLRSPTPREPTGRGLRVVEALSDSWGIEPKDDGKAVWFTVVAQPGTTDQSPRTGLDAA